MSDPPERRVSSGSMGAVRPVPQPMTIEDVGREVRALRSLFDAHIQDQRFEEKRAQLRHDAIMGMLQDVLVRLPDAKPDAKTEERETGS